MKTFLKIVLKWKLFSTFVFRSRCLGFWETLFGKTLVWDQTNEAYIIKNLSGPQRKVNCRWTPFESLSKLLHPQLGNFRFQVIRDKIQKCVEWLDKDANAARFKDQKIKFLNGLIRILDEFNDNDREYNNAVGHFCKAIMTIYGTERETGAAQLLYLAQLKGDENLFKRLYRSISIQDNIHDEDEDLYCGLLKNSTISEDFWPQLSRPEIAPIWVSDQSINALQDFARSVLSFERNQSNLERSFSSFARKELGRNRLTNDQMFNEEKFRCILKQWSIFQDCNYDDPGLKLYNPEGVHEEVLEVQSEEDLDKEVFEIGQTLQNNEKPMLQFDDDSEDSEEYDFVERYVSDCLCFH